MNSPANTYPGTPTAEGLSATIATIKHVKPNYHITVPLGWTLLASALEQDEDLDQAQEVLAEPIQTVMRRYNIEKPYEKLKALTRGQAMTRDMMVNFVNGDELSQVPSEERARLAELTPATYTGNAAEQAKQINDLISKI
jgi:adenylosuccinate lyase